MSTALTKKRILDAAEQVFAEDGFKGASLRHITDLAHVDLGAVRYHFDSKTCLFGEVIRRRVDPLCEERLRRLDALEAAHPLGAPLESLIEAFLRPALALVNEPGMNSWIKLIGRVRVEPGDYLDGVQAKYQVLLQRFLVAFRRALPEVGREDLAYRFFFLFGAEVNTLIDNGTLKAMEQSLPNLSEDPQAVGERLIQFAVAGMRAPSGNGAPLVSPFGGRRPEPDPKQRTRVG
jgi:AcrR family transcriptional regulator